MFDVELFGLLVNLSLSCGGNALIDEIPVTFRVFSLRGVDTDQADFTDGVYLERIAVVDPADSALQGRCRCLCVDRQSQGEVQAEKKREKSQG